jgi:hypothetical protein
MAADASAPPADALGAIAKAAAAVRHADRARVWVVGSSRHQAAIREDLDRLLAALDPAPAPRMAYTPGLRVLARARARGAAPASASIAALVNPNATNAALVHSAPGVTYDAPSDDALVDYLTAKVFDGVGGHSFYKRIWGAGLAYSGWVGSWPSRERTVLYADRCADLGQLLRFVDGEVRRAPVDPRAVDYAVTGAFGSRVAEPYESRAAAMAWDLATGTPPERVRELRARLLAMRARPGLAETLHARLAAVYAAVIPSLAPAAPLAPDALLFAVGPERHIADYERALQSSRPDVKVLRLYPRDFW